MLSALEEGGLASNAICSQTSRHSMASRRARGRASRFALHGELFIFRHRKPLHYLQRAGPYDDEPVYLRGSRHNRYELTRRREKERTDRATVIATEKLTGEDWKVVPDRTLLLVTLHGLLPAEPRPAADGAAGSHGTPRLKPNASQGSGAMLRARSGLHVEPPHHAAARVAGQGDLDGRFRRCSRRKRSRWARHRGHRRRRDHDGTERQ